MKHMNIKPGNGPFALGAVGCDCKDCCLVAFEANAVIISHLIEFWISCKICHERNYVNSKQDVYV